ncbi:hypothetical protein [Lysobacter gummosus]|uniref:hypothetical protein n=1 Tax=Lysobacter gummosus TaxID=262324 RepID=UPI00363E827A
MRGTRSYFYLGWPRKRVRASGLRASLPTRGRCRHDGVEKPIGFIPSISCQISIRSSSHVRIEIPFAPFVRARFRVLRCRGGRRAYFRCCPGCRGSQPGT